MRPVAHFTADQLKKALRSRGVLRAGSVKTVTTESTRLTVLSRIVRLAVTSHDGSPDAPPYGVGAECQAERFHAPQKGALPKPKRCEFNSDGPAILAEGWPIQSIVDEV